MYCLFEEKRKTLLTQQIKSVSETSASVVGSA
jgi:hypothetical protein